VSDFVDCGRWQRFSAHWLFRFFRWLGYWLRRVFLRSKIFEQTLIVLPC
jgi:hypothetical protein